MEHAYCICREIIGKTGEFDADGNELYYGDTVAFDKSLAAELKLISPYTGVIMPDAIEYGVDCVACARFDCHAVVVTKRRRELFIISIQHCLPHIHLLERGVIP